VTSLSESAWAIPVQAAGRRIPVGGDLLGGVDRARLLRDPAERVEDRGSSPRRPDDAASAPGAPDRTGCTRTGVAAAEDRSRRALPTSGVAL
jgi:hypothetical protein